LLDTGALVRYHAILEEDALQRIVSDPELLRTQAGRMIELVTEPDRVTIQLLPTSVGPHPGVAGPFSVLELEEDAAALAYVEATQGGESVEVEEAVNMCRRIRSQLLDVALAPGKTVEILRRMTLLAGVSSVH